MNVTVDEEGTYKAKLRVEASSNALAKESAVARVEEFLALQAARNDGFRVRLRAVRATRLHDESAVSVERDKERTTHITKTLEPPEATVDMVVQRSSVGIVKVALENRGQWPMSSEQSLNSTI